ncbi:MAG: hypothetical protein QOG75_664 [Mycobacterium sp.]|nr:hypothetical protein [Mycobacterium sp.]
MERVGAAGVSMREIARRAGVTHAALAYQFGDKAGLFTAVATEGFRLAAAAIGPAATGPEGFLHGGMAYVMFALTHPGHYEVMFRPDLYGDDDPNLIEARNAAFAILYGSADQPGRAARPRHHRRRRRRMVVVSRISHPLAHRQPAGPDRRRPNPAGPAGRRRHHPARRACQPPPRHSQRGKHERGATAAGHEHGVNDERPHRSMVPRSRAASRVGFAGASKEARVAASSPSMSTTPATSSRASTPAASPRPILASALTTAPSSRPSCNAVASASRTKLSSVAVELAPGNGQRAQCQGG